MVSKVSLIAVLSLAVVAFAGKLSFTPIAAPNTTQYTYGGFSRFNVDGKNYNSRYTPLLESGKTYPGFVSGTTWAVGTIKDIYGVDLTTSDSANANPALANNFDRTSIFEKFGKIWAFTQNEEVFGNMYLMELSQNAITGALTIAKAKTLNLGSINGMVRPCSGYMTPWNTHLAGEEDAQEARNFPPASPISAFVAQALVHRLASWNLVNPYWYGYVVEASVTSANGDYTVKKRYSLGRLFHETAVCFADRRTCLTTDDDGSGGILNLFVADVKNDLSSGKLYAARPYQIRTSDGGAFKLKWIHLNPDRTSVHESTVAAAVAGATYAEAPVKFADLFDVATPVYLADGKTPDLTQLPAGFKEVKTRATRYEWLKLKAGMGPLASRMETRRMAAYVGASVEFTKPEGLTYDRKNRVAYLALTSIRVSMLNNNGTADIGGLNAIKLPYNYGGAVYKLELGAYAGVSAYAPLYMKAILTSYGFNGDEDGTNTIPFDSIASPDNVGIMSTYQKLLISEDCDTQHVNNFLWAYDLVTGQLDRLYYSPFDGEVTSGYYFANIGKFSYITATSQHPRQQDVPCTMGYWVLPYDKEYKY